MNLTGPALASLLDSLYKRSRDTGTDLEVLGIMLAVAVRGYKKSLGEDQAAMLFYTVADELATGMQHDGESDSGDEQ